jgi:arsenite-transporting ATPase
MRLILVSGGGGAGVTTFAAATAVTAAARGVHTRLAAADPARIGAVLGPPDVWPRMLDVTTATQAGLRNDTVAVLRWLRPFLRRVDLDEWTAEDLQALPVVRGLVALLAAVEGNPDLAVVDAGPADEALTLLQILCLDPVRGPRPVAGWTTGQIAGTIVAQAIDMPRADASVKEAGRRLTERIAAVSASVRDPAASSLRVVVPDDDRAAGLVSDVRTFAGLWGIGLDALACRVASTAAANADVGLTIPRCADLPQGAAPLHDLGESIYGVRSPELQIAQAQGPYIETRDGGADLVLPVPELPASAFQVGRRGAELMIKAGRWRRALPLPRLLQPMHARRAWHDGRVFRVRFEV